MLGCRDQLLSSHDHAVNVKQQPYSIVLLTGETNLNMRNITNIATCSQNSWLVTWFFNDCNCNNIYILQLYNVIFKHNYCPKIRFLSQISIYIKLGSTNVQTFTKLIVAKCLQKLQFKICFFNKFWLFDSIIIINKL